jgi:hypothetical protein
MTEEAFLRYRIAVVERMPDSPSKQELLIAIQSRVDALKMRNARFPVELSANAGGGQA